MEGHPDFEQPLSRKPKSPLSAFGLLTSTLWLVVAAAGFGAFFVWYFYTLEEGPAPPAYEGHAPEQPSRALHDAAPQTDILLQNLNTRRSRAFRAVLFGHPVMHCAVRVNPFQDSNAYLIVFVRKGENLSLSLPRQKYQGVLACGSIWDEEDFSFVGVSPQIYSDADFFANVQTGRASGVDLGNLWGAGM